MTPPGLLYRWRAAVQRSDLHATSKLVCWTLSTYMDRDGGSCWPSLERISSESSLAVRTVRRHLRFLEDDGWLVVQVSKGGQHQTNRYWAAFPDGR